MKDSEYTAFILRACVCIGIIIAVLGLITNNVHILWFGILTLICAPFLGIITSFVSLFIEKDWYWVKISAVLIMITIAGISISLVQ